MERKRRTRQWARENAGVFALLPWREGGSAEWEEYVWGVLSECADWATRGHHFARNLSYLRALGQVFDEYAAERSFSEGLERRFQAILANVYPTYQAKGQGSGVGWQVTADSDLFRRVGQLAGRLWEAIGRGAVGTRLQRCRVCGMVRYFQRQPRPGDYACSRACQEIRRQLRAADSDISPIARRYIATPEDYVAPKAWHVTEVSPLPTAGTRQVTARTDLPADATGRDKGKGSAQS